MTTAYPNGQFFAEGNYPSWLPVPQGQVPIVYADFVNGNYWYSGSAYAGFPAWVAATGGSFNRSTGATYCGSLGLMQSVPIGTTRFDYDPVTKHPLGIYLEPIFDNSILYSQTFSNAAWTKTNVTEADASAIAPDGTTTGALITESGSGTVAHEVSQLLSGDYGCLSVYAKAGTGNYLNLAIDDGVSNAYVQAVFDLSQGGITEYSVGSGNSGLIFISFMLIEPAPDFGAGWYHCVLKLRDTSSPTAMTYHIGLAPAAHGNTYGTAGQALYASGGKTVFIWGAQVPSSPAFPLSYVATTGTVVVGGGDRLIIGAAWDSASISISCNQVYDIRGQSGGGVGNITSGGYYGSNEDSWYAQLNSGISSIVQGPSGSLGSAFTAQIAGVNSDAFRVDATTAIISNNGNPAVTSGAGSARTAATNIRLGGYETSVGLATPMRLRSFAAWKNGFTNTALQSLSKLPGAPAPAIASTVDGADPNWVGYPGFCVLPSGYLLVDYNRYNTSSQGARPAQIMYQTAPAPTGPWSAQAVAVANTNSNIDTQSMTLLTLPSGSILGVCNPSDFTAPYNSSNGLGTLQIVIGTEVSPGVLTWSAPIAISGGPFFGVSAAGTTKGDFTESAPILLPDGKWMQLLYGYKPGASLFSTGAIFSTNPSSPTSWGNFTIIADGSVFTPNRSFDEANAFVDPLGNIVVIIRQEVNSVAVNSGADYWRVVCPAGADPTVAANWRAPTFMAFDVAVGKPDVISLGNNGMWLMTRGAVGSNNLVGYNWSWNNGASPFPGNRAAALEPTFNNRQYWYSQSQLLPGTGFIGTAVGVDSPVAIYFLVSAINGAGQSQ